MLALYKKREKMSRQDRLAAARLLAGSPLGVNGIADLTYLTPRDVRRVLGRKRGGRFKAETLPDISHLAYLKRIGARLDRDAMHRVQSAGTSQATVAALMGISRQRLHQLMNEED
jgi:predicted DNA-binding protein (UPF0251 family)